MEVVLVHPEIPHNTGSVGRTCVAVGAKLWLVRPLGFLLDEKHLRRAGMDYWEHLELEVCENWEELIGKIPRVRPWYFSKWAEQTYTEVTYQRGDVLVFGSESSGLPSTLLEGERDRLLRLPMREQVRSINLSACVAAAAYEAYRQCQLPPELRGPDSPR